MERESFVVHAEYLEDLSEKYRAEFSAYICNFGIFSIEPDFSGFAPEIAELKSTIWLKIKRRIEADSLAYDRKIKNLKQSKSSATVRTPTNGYRNTENNASDDRQTIIGTPTDIFRNTENDVSDDRLDDRTEPLGDRTGGVNDIEFVNDTVNENVCVSEFAGGTPAGTHAAPELPSEKYSDTIFGIFRDANLPCCGNNKVSFMQRDFAQGIGYLHKAIPNLHSDEVIQACRNYASLAQNPDLYKGYGKHLSFDSLARKEWFKSLLPSDFNESDFLTYGGKESGGAENAESKKRTPEQAELELFSQIQANSEFIPAIFNYYRDDWIRDGCPTGASYMDFQRKKELAPYGQKLKKQFLEKRGG